MRTVTRSWFPIFKNLLIYST